MVTLTASRVLHPDGTLAPATVHVDGERIAALTPAGTGSPDRIIAPGFIDLQVNGHGSVDIASARDGDWDELDGILVRQGVTAWCPTLVSAPLASYAPALDRIAAAARRAGSARPAILGAHLEGPFLGGAPGAHRRDNIIAVDAGWIDALPPIVRVVTLAPEATGAAEAIAALRRRGIVVALGHSTATAATSRTGFDAGARLVTHLFNAMAPFHHREPGLAGAALDDDRVVVSLIADGVHVAPELLRVTFLAKPPGRVTLVTDAVASRDRTGMAGADGAARLADGTLAGSTITMGDAIRTCVGAGVPLADVLTAATATPAMALGQRPRGSIRPGAPADLVIMDPDLALVEVWIAGRPAWAAG